MLEVPILKKEGQTPELNEDGTPKVIDPQPENEDHVPQQEEKETEEEHLGDEEEEEERKPETETPPQNTQVPAVDYKKKFSESTKRNQIVESQFRELQKVLGDITRQEIPSDEEMIAIDPDWEYRSDFEKNLSIKTIVLEKRQNQILHTIGNITKETELSEKIVTFIESEPKLKGKEESFYDFATSPKNKGASMEVLLGAFLYNAGDTTEVPTPTPPSDERPPMLNRATPRGGNDPKPEKDGNYTDEEMKVLRTQNPKQYFKLIRTGKL